MKMSQTNLQYTAPGDVGGQILAELVKVLGIVVGVAATPFLLDLLAARWPQYLPWFWVVGAVTAVLTIIVGGIYAFQQARRRRQRAAHTAPQKLFLERIVPPFTVKAYAQRDALTEKQLAALQQAREAGAISAAEYERLAADLALETETETAVESWSLLPTIIITIGVFILLPAVVALLMQQTGNEEPGLIAQFFGAPVFLLWITAELLYFYPLRIIEHKQAAHIVGIIKALVQIVAALVLWIYLGIDFGIGGVAWLFYAGVGLALVGLIAGIVAAVLNGRLARQQPVPAEDTTTPDSEPKKQKTPASPQAPSKPRPTPEALPAGHFLLTRSDYGRFGFQLVLENGDVVLMSEEYAAKEACLRELRAVRHNALLGERYRQETAGHRHYFVLLDSEEQVIAASPIFPSAPACQTHIEYAKALAFRAPLKDETALADTLPEKTSTSAPAEEPELKPTVEDEKPAAPEPAPPSSVPDLDGVAVGGRETAVPPVEPPPSTATPPDNEPDLTLLSQAKAPKFQLFRGQDGEFYFRLIARNGEMILNSQGYKRKASGVNGIRSVKKNASSTEQFLQQVATNGLFYFTLLARNHEVIGVSEMYTSTQSRDEGITAVSRLAWDAPIEDLTANGQGDDAGKEPPSSSMDKPEKVDKTPARQPRFQIFRGDNDLYYFHLRAANGEIILASEGYETLRGCGNGIRSVQQNGPLAERYVPETAENGQYYFKLLARNRKVIGVSEMYRTRQNRDRGITAVQQTAANALVEQFIT